MSKKVLKSLKPKSRKVKFPKISLGQFMRQQLEFKRQKRRKEEEENVQKLIDDEYLK